MIKYYIQKFLALFLDKPFFREGTTVGFSLVKSERSNVKQDIHTRVYAPFFMHDVAIGEYSYVARNCHISNTIIGKFCSIGPNFNCGLGIHPTNGISTSPMFYSVAKQNGTSLCSENKIEETKLTNIGHDVFIGANVMVLDGVNIGNGAVIGAGAVVVDDIPPYAVAVGVPAKVVKYRFSKDMIEKLQEMQWWNRSAEELKEVETNFWNLNDFVK